MKHLTKKLHFLTSLLLSFILLFSSFSVVFATESVAITEDSHLNVYRQIANVTNIIETNNTVAFDAEYELSNGIVKESVVIEEKSDGKYVYASSERGTDTLYIDNDGKAYINGEEVIITIQENNILPSLNTGITPFAQRYNKFVTDCPYGTASNYTTRHNDLTHNITLPQPLQEIAVAVVVELIMSTVIPGATITAAAFRASIGVAVETMINDAIDAIEDEYAISVRCTRYVHDTMGAYINGEYIYRCLFRYYRGLDAMIYVDSNSAYNIIKT